MASKADVFIIESLTLANERDVLHEGEVLSRMLRLSRKNPMYYYVRTKTELRLILREFRKSHYRYLHLSCHGSEHAAHTTFDKIGFPELGQILRPFLEKRRLFVSACAMTGRSFARELLPDSGIYSLLGPANDVFFSQAAILWCSFYHLMFRDERHSMQGQAIRRNGNAVAKLFEAPLNYHRRAHNSTGFATIRLPELAI